MQPGKKKRGPKRKPYVPSKRDMEIYELCLTSKKSLREIGEQFSISPSRVFAIRKRVTEFTRLAHADKAMDIKSEYTAKCQMAQKEAWASYQKSKEIRRKKRMKTITGGKNGDTIEDEQTDEEAYGDPKFLDIFLKAAHMEARAWGADEPPEVVVSATSRVAGNDPESARLALEQEILLIAANLPNGMKLLAQMAEGNRLTVDGQVLG